MIRSALALLLVSGALAAQAPLTLAGALRQAGASSAQAELATLALRGAQGERDEVKASWFPEIELKGGHLNLDRDAALRTESFTVGPIPGLGSLTVPSLEQPVAQKSSWRYHLTASYLLYDFGRRSSALEALRAKELAVDLGGRDAVGRAKADVASRYVTLLNLRARRKVVDQRRQALQDHLRDARSLFEQGVVARNDLLRTEVALRAVDDAGRSLDNALVSARESLNIAMGLAPGTAQVLPESLPPPPALPWNEAAVRALAPQANAGVKALEAKVKAAEGQVDFRRRDFAPNVVAQLGHSYEENRFLAHPQQTTLYLGLSWKLFDGGARSARISRSRAEEGSARRELLEARRQAENAAAAALRAHDEALAEMGTARANVDAAVENLRIVSEQYQQAYAKSADVLDAETVLAESRFSLSDRLCRAYAVQAGLLALLGEDLETFYATRSLEH
ncbi:TolC family protein [Mesoterricola silvestris]|uniref:Protein CyaE n=1 Tax=Mesoterricola silvestris TaxID=2927979 RepID=A0AA48H944_9BACT|nr:TolC family protein [Mesoterricola silvestris]BDU74058.1 protein CyaE [Mesoterricola silvestris]